ncbi:hypothetical protein GL2_23160 [Microbulbifer sp. GL-2]|nr:hypothetical protein GL2_23160 [Microbulbifer sp. GL-2]
MLEVANSWQGQKAQAVLIADAETLNSFFGGLCNSLDLFSRWEIDRGLPDALGNDKGALNTAEQAHGFYEHINIYPLIEIPCAMKKGATRRRCLATSGDDGRIHRHHNH